MDKLMPELEITQIELNGTFEVFQ